MFLHADGNSGCCKQQRPKIPMSSIHQSSRKLLTGGMNSTDLQAMPWLSPIHGHYIKSASERSQLSSLPLWGAILNSTNMVEPLPRGHHALFNHSSLQAGPARSACHSARLQNNNSSRHHLLHPGVCASVAAELAEWGGGGELVSQLLLGFHRPKCLRSGWGVEFAARHFVPSCAIRGDGEQPICSCAWDKHHIATWNNSIQVSSDLAEGWLCPLLVQGALCPESPRPRQNTLSFRFGAFMDIPT